MEQTFNKRKRETHQEEGLEDNDAKDTGGMEKMDSAVKSPKMEYPAI